MLPVLSIIKQKVEFTVEVNDKSNKDKFHIKAVILGIFSYKSDVKKEIIHVFFPFYLIFKTFSTPMLKMGAGLELL